MNQEALLPIKETIKFLSPTHPTGIHRRLFAKSDFELYEERGTDWREQEALLLKRRADGLSEIIALDGITSLVDFIKSVDAPEKVGRALASLSSDKIDSLLLPTHLTSDDEGIEQCASDYAYTRWWHEGWQWVQNLDISSWSKECQLAFFISTPPSAQVWDVLQANFSNIWSNYWEKAPFNRYIIADDEVELVTGELIKHNRPRDAVLCYSVPIHKKLPVNVSKLASALRDSVSSQEDTSIDSYRFKDAIEYLQNDKTVDLDSLLFIEWAYLTFFDSYSGERPKTLELYLSTKPIFFCEVIRMAYKSRTGWQAATPHDDETKSKIATQAYRLLHYWKRLPGADGNGRFNADHFINWLNEVKAICEETGHIEMALYVVGEVLHYCPADEDGFWINKVIAGVLNSIDADRMRDGYSIKTSNSRGSHFVDPTGAPERALAEKYRSRAEIACRCWLSSLC